MDSNAFAKKTVEVGRPATSYIETSQKKYLNFDFADMRASLKQLEHYPKTQLEQHHKVTHNRDPAQTIKKPLRIPHLSETRESKQNTDSHNIRDTKYKAESLKPNADKSEILTSMVSGDGKQQITSRCLNGEELSKATIHEVTQSTNEKRRVYPLMVDPGAKILNYQPTKISTKKVGVVCCYAANTNIGISRNYNEDRVSIILNISKESTKCSVFAIYDGHGGTTCCDYLRDNLHQNIISSQHFPSNPKQAIVDGVKETEVHLLSRLEEQLVKNNKLDKSGSCGIMAIVMGNECYLANIGDSRAVLSADGGRFSYNLSRDHKPVDSSEQKRILMTGGRIYRTEMSPITPTADVSPIYGPLRVYPGKLSVSRTFGDLEAKLQKLGGNPKVVIAEPEIKQFVIKDNHDFIVLGCDGIFDKIESKQVVKLVWETVEQYTEEIGQQQINIHQLCGRCVESILREAMNRRSMDNLTVVMVAFYGFEERVRRGGINYMTTSLKSIKSEKRSPRQFDV